MIYRKICTGMENDSTFMDGDTLKLLVETVIPNEYIKGMQMGLRFCEIVEDTPSKKFLEVFDTVHLLLFPTGKGEGKLCGMGFATSHISLPFSLC